MADVLIIGIDPQHLDLSDPANLVAGPVTAESIRAGLNGAKAALEERGHAVEIAWIDLGETAEAVVRSILGTFTPDLVVIGAGIRMVKENTELFESMVNVTNRAVPRVQFAFNSEPGSTLEAALRWI